jgi:hypothetical protein
MPMCVYHVLLLPTFSTLTRVRGGNFPSRSYSFVQLRTASYSFVQLRTAATNFGRNAPGAPPSDKKSAERIGNRGADLLRVKAMKGHSPYIVFSLSLFQSHFSEKI